MPATVYTMDLRSHSTQTGLVAQALRLFEAAGYDDLINPGEIVAVKIHCGEWNNTSYLRPVYVRAICDRIKELGGKPFVCDTTTLTYSPAADRVTAPDLIRVAERNGFTSATLGAPFLAADGFNGTDDLRIELPEGYILREAYIAKAIALADAAIVLTHFKGHAIGVIGGSIKNLGIGAQSKRGKYNVHMGGHPSYSLAATVVEHPEHVNDMVLNTIPNLCPYGALQRNKESYQWHREKCTGCLGCLGLMINNGVWEPPTEYFAAQQAAMADGALAAVKALKGNVGFINFAIDVSPQCDCADFSDTAVVPHIGLFAGRDPVALDQACLDAIVAAQGNPGSSAEDWDVMGAGDHKLVHTSPVVTGASEETQIKAGAQNGLGDPEYILTEVEPHATAEAYRDPMDRRVVGLKYGPLYRREDPFPRERHNGHGFDRKTKIDIDAVR